MLQNNAPKNTLQHNARVFATFPTVGFQVFVTDFDGKTLTVDVDNKMTIDALKSEISTKKGIVPADVVTNFHVLLERGFS